MVKNNQRLFKDKDEVVSMFIGLAVVVVFALILVNFVQRRKGNISIPGVKDEIKNEEVTSKVAEEENIVTIEKNDSLWKIAVKTYNNGYKWTEIARANNLKNPGLLFIGQKLVLPKIEKTSTITTVKEKAPILNQNSEYTVVRGDSLWKIAVKVYGDGYKWTEIYRANKNKLNSPDKLEIGMKLLIYGKI
jgi:putative chitinase